MDSPGHKNDFDKLLVTVMRQAAAAGIPYSDKIDPHITVNSRAKSRFGLCKKTSCGYSIELSSILLDAPELSCKQTIAHELLHTCRGCYDHGELFRKYAAVMNTLYGYNIKRTNSCEEMGLSPRQKERTINYILQCVECGRQIKRTRFSSVIAKPSKYTCICGGKLRRIK